MISGDHDCPKFINSQRGSVSHSYSSRSTVCDANSFLLAPCVTKREKWVVCLSHRASGKNVIGFGAAVLFLVTTKRHGALRPLIGQLQETHHRHPSECQTRRKMQNKLWHVCLEEPESWGVLNATLIV